MLLKTKLILGLGTTAVICGGSSAVYYGVSQVAGKNEERSQNSFKESLDYYFGENLLI